jgi:hypothetical protein
MNLEDEYLRRVKEIDDELSRPEISEEINMFLLKLNKKYKADFMLSFEVFPESDDYVERINANDIKAPRDYPTMTLGEFIKHVDTEDHEIKIYIDPLYMEHGVNAINNILTTTAGEDAMIIAPVSHKKK